MDEQDLFKMGLTAIILAIIPLIFDLNNIKLYIILYIICHGASLASGVLLLVGGKLVNKKLVNYGFDISVLALIFIIISSILIYFWNQVQLSEIAVEWLIKLLLVERIGFPELSRFFIQAYINEITSFDMRGSISNFIIFFGVLQLFLGIIMVFVVKGLSKDSVDEEKTSLKTLAGLITKKIRPEYLEPLLAQKYPIIKYYCPNCHELVKKEAIKSEHGKIIREPIEEAKFCISCGTNLINFKPISQQKLYWKHLPKENKISVVLGAIIACTAFFTIGFSIHLTSNFTSPYELIFSISLIAGAIINILAGFALLIGSNADILKLNKAGYILGLIAWSLLMISNIYGLFRVQSQQYNLYLLFFINIIISLIYITLGSLSFTILRSEKFISKGKIIKFCPFCGKIIEIPDNYCQFCGKKIRLLKAKK